MESFWSTLKLELIYRREFSHRHRARTEIFDYMRIAMPHGGVDRHGSEIDLPGLPSVRSAAIVKPAQYLKISDAALLMIQHITILTVTSRARRWEQCKALSFIEISKYVMFQHRTTNRNGFLHQLS